MSEIRKLTPEELEEKRKKENEVKKKRGKEKMNQTKNGEETPSKREGQLNPISYEVVSSTADFKRPKLNEREDTIIIKQVILGKKGKYGEYAMVLTEAGWFRATSTVLLKQLKQIKKYIDALDRPVKARIKVRESGSGQRYFTFVAP